MDRGGRVVQSLNPGRGQMRRRGSQDALLARGIAAPRGSRRVPALTGVRSVLRRSPKAVRLGKLGPDRMRGKWLVLCVLFLATAVAYGAWIGGPDFQKFWPFYRRGADPPLAPGLRGERRPPGRPPRPPQTPVHTPPPTRAP